MPCRPVSTVSESPRIRSVRPAAPERTPPPHSGRFGGFQPRLASTLDRFRAWAYPDSKRSGPGSRMVRGVKRIVVTAAIVAVAALAPVCRADAVETQARLPVPRFVSLRSDKVNLRTGPGDRYPIEWVL